MYDEIRLPNDGLDELAEQYAGGEAAIEAFGHYCPMYELFDEHLDVTLVNPSKNMVIADATVKPDRIDARTCFGRAYSQKVMCRRMRKALVEERTAEKNRVEPSSNVPTTPTTASYSTRTDEAELSLSDADRTIVETHFSVIDEHNTKIEQRALESPVSQRLLSILGVGKSTAALPVAEIGEIDWFDRHEELIIYARLNPMVHQSGDMEASVKRAQRECAGFSFSTPLFPSGMTTTLGASTHGERVIERFAGVLFQHSLIESAKT